MLLDSQQPRRKKAGSARQNARGLVRRVMRAGGQERHGHRHRALQPSRPRQEGCARMGRGWSLCGAVGIPATSIAAIGNDGRLMLI